MSETWKAVPGYEGFYEASNLGRMRSCTRVVAHPSGNSRRPGQNIKARTSPYGYSLVNLSRDGEQKTKFVHRLVLETFVGPCPDGMQACHKNGDQTNNAINNLRWGTPAENQADRIDHGTSNRGVANPMAKLSESEVLEIDRRIQGGEKSGALAGKYGVSIQCIDDIRHRNKWSHILASALRETPGGGE